MERSWVSSPAYRIVIDQLIAARNDAGVGQRELARKLGKHASWLNKIEKLERRLDVLELIAIARALNVAPMDLVARMDAALPPEAGI